MQLPAFVLTFPTPSSSPAITTHLLLAICFRNTSAGVERNAIIGDDAAARKADIPIIQLNHG